MVESLRGVTDLPLHCHLMVDQPELLLKDFAEAGADIVTAHVEAVDDPARIIRDAEALGVKAGLALNPQTEADALFPYLEELDRVIVMTLYRTGFAGQPFNEDMLPKIESVRKEIDRQGLRVEVEVDGGIDERSGPRCIAAGATVLAAASSIFKAADPADAARRLRQAAEGPA